MNYLGIDPGKSGGFALIYSEDPKGVVHTFPMPDTEADVWQWFADLPEEPTLAIIERVTGFVPTWKDETGQMRGGQGDAMFKFGMGYGGLRMALTASEIPFEAVMASVWQKAMGIPSKNRGETKTQHKNKIKARAQELFPGVKITLATADALMLAEYCRRLRTRRF